MVPIKTKYVTELTENVYKTRIKIRAEWFAKSTVQTSDPISDATTFYFIPYKMSNVVCQQLGTLKIGWKIRSYFCDVLGSGGWSLDDLICKICWFSNVDFLGVILALGRDI